MNTAESNVTSTETYADFCVRIGAVSKLKLARMYDAGTIKPPSIAPNDTPKAPTLKKHYRIKS